MKAKLGKLKQYPRHQKRSFPLKISIVNVVHIKSSFFVQWKNQFFITNFYQQLMQSHTFLVEEKEKQYLSMTLCINSEHQGEKSILLHHLTLTNCQSRNISPWSLLIITNRWLLVTSGHYQPLVASHQLSLLAVGCQ